jgi:orotate phosphoribosyltransferase
MDIAANSIKRVAASTRIDKLASIELKGALLLASIGCRTGLPCTVVRKEEKTYGATGRIAGAEVAKDEHVLFFDDVVSEGLSKLEGIKPLEQLGAKVENIMVVVDREHRLQSPCSCKDIRNRQLSSQEQAHFKGTGGRRSILCQKP